MLQFDGSKLKELRKSRNLKQKDLAAIVGVKSQSHIANYENGVADPPSHVLLRLMEFFDVPAKKLSKEAEKVTI